MEVMATEEKPKQPLPVYGGHPPPLPPPHPLHHPPPPGMSRGPPPPDGPHGLPPSHGLYEHPWRPYPPYEGPNADQRRHSTPAHPPIPPHGYPPPPPNRELPQLPPDPYARPSSLPAPAPIHSPPDAHPAHPSSYRPMNGAPNDLPPHSAPGDYRPPRMPFPPHESGSGNGEPPPPGHYVTGIPPHMPPTPGPYPNDYYNNPMFGARQRKAARAQQACDQCRARKAKCDEGRPACSHCKENHLTCVYKEVPPHKQEKATQLVLDRLQQLEDRMAQFQAVQLEQITRIVTQQGLSPSILDPSKSTPASKLPLGTDEPLVEPGASSRDNQEETTSPADPKSENTPSRSILLNPIMKAERDPSLDAALKDEDDGELSIPIEHTTAAHKLLGWPSIRQLLGKDIGEDYVMRLEEQRGLIRVYGRGEGDDRSDYDRTSVSSPSTTNSSSSPNWDEDAQAGSPNVPWGVGLPFTTAYRPREQAGGLDEFGQLNTEPELVRRLHRTYVNHIHVLHPFLDEANLERKVERFIKIYSPHKKGPIGQINRPAEVNRGAKRKRSSEALHLGGYEMTRSPGSNSEKVPPRRIERSIDNAIILLVLALGAICEWRDKPLPGPIPDTVSNAATTSFLNNVLSPTVSESHPNPASFQSPSNTWYSPEGAEFRRPGQYRPLTGHEGSEHSYSKNMDVIPGLAYYAYATDILGNLQGGNGLYHVQASLLAGLYAGQLAHPFQSHGWISQASRACQVLVRSKRYETMKDGPMKDLCEFAYWTCLQLESDILAELDLPASGISRSENRIHLPKGVHTLSLPNEIKAPNTMMMFYYSAQIHLRKVLNRVHTDLYKVEPNKNAPADKAGLSNHFSSHVLEVLSMNLEFWRKSLPDAMKWTDNEPPAKDIIIARLRAKYYGARYIIHRPLLYYALHDMCPPQESSAATESPQYPSSQPTSKPSQVSPTMSQNQQSTGMSRWPSDTGISGRSSDVINWPTTTFEMLPKHVQRACRICIESAIQSTEAFDCIEGRPIVTNIFGTAHAQFGNMLVLSATYMSHLRELVDGDDLNRLLLRTMNFLRQSKNISPSLSMDANILARIYRKIFHESPNSSFTE